VFTDAREIPEAKLQPLARELNLPETTFVYPPVEGGHVRMRIFTPGAELQFAGHPTLGTAFVLGAPLQLVEIRIETGRGIVPVTLEREGARISFGWMSQPIPTVHEFAESAALERALGVESTLPVELYDLGIRHTLVSVPSAEQLAGLRPDLAALSALDSQGFYCFAPNSAGWKARVFLPAIGIDEDPATGSGAGPLALHLARHGRVAFGDEIEIEQGVEIGRRSTLRARIEGTAGAVERIEVGGAAVIVARGEFSF
jgi:trans-2,3-dihydro-3-hydroxyanthranilate isomerase